ncbi:MFS transporter [Curtobacterium sp. UCD-KPL2560]|uniref:MFS transporter n=1 Tax=Curtobacterium sp. UCD-KPL2560 TaxID=1885315 RepID=UPI0009F48038|nr:MFS transporter [Curtobacterium sp. UCD-KPL2560]
MTTPSGDENTASALSAPSPEGAQREIGVFDPQFRWVTIGMFLLVLLDAFVALAVSTIMPIISAELDGAGLYAFAFAGPVAVSVVGMVLAGIWSDRGNPLSALIVSVVVFAAGLTVVALAPSMVVFVSGRLVHGLAGGAITVALYVIVARIYPQALHAKVFAAFATAWVIPSLVGPVIAGVLTETVGWRWVFFGVVALVLLAMPLVVAASRVVQGPDERASIGRSEVVRLGLAMLTASSALVITLAAESRGPTQWLVPSLAAVVAMIALRPLLPAGTLRARRGLPSVVLKRALVAATFFAAEVYVPLLLVSHYGTSAALAGVALTAAALSWSAASWVQGRFPTIGHVLAARIGTASLGTAVACLFVTALTSATPIVVVVGWAFAGAGIGLIYPRLGVLTLGYSSKTNQGFNSSALTIAEATASSIVLAVMAIVFAAFGGAASTSAFAAVFALAGALCVLAWLCAPRIVPRATP